jgi:RNA polymerase sigma-70 factor, ECF subfamily
MSSTEENPESGSTPDQEMAWMLRFKDGDQHGFFKILHRYEKPVINFSFRYLKEQAAAEDVAQEVFLEVFRNAHNFRPTGKVSTWIFKIAYNRCMDLLRRKKIVTFFSLESWFSSQDEEQQRDVEDTQQVTPAEDEEKKELQKAIADALASLPETQRTAVMLAKYEDMSLEEVGHVMGVSVGAVKQLIFRSKTALKEELKRLVLENEPENQR